jgi:peptide/nickel transport system substrate-binding protein
MKRLFLRIMAVGMLIALFAACGGKGKPASSTGSAAPADKMFNIILTAPFTGFDPLRTNDSASTYVNAQIYETLYRLPPATTEFTCLLAENLPEFSEDGRTAAIKLREGIKFHDGTPFNAEAVKYTIELIKDPKFGSARASIASSIASVEIVDDYNLKLHLTYSDGVLTAKLAHTNAAIVSPTAQKGQDLMVNPVGTGP